MHIRPIFEKLKQLTLPARIKADLLLLWRYANRLVEKVLDFVVRHRKFGEAVILGAVVAYLLSLLPIPILANLLALVALATAAAVGLMAELRQDLTAAFGDQPAN